MEHAMSDPYSRIPDGTEWCPHCNGYGSSLMEESARCTRCGGSGLVTVADGRDQEADRHEPRTARDAD
jgi:hypothetical protein